MEKNVESMLRGSLFKALVEQQVEVICKKYDFRRVDIEVLYYLSSNPDVNTARDIQKYLKINKGYVSQIVDNLCRQGYLQAVTDKADRRYVHYVLTSKTDGIARETHLIWKDIGSRVFKGITEQEQAEFKRIATKIQDNIREMLNE